MKSWMERYEEASSNQYSEEVRILLRVKEARDGKTLAYNTHTAAFKPPVEVLNSPIQIPPQHWSAFLVGLKLSEQT